MPYIAMQYVEGETLAQRIATTRERLTTGDGTVNLLTPETKADSSPTTETEPLDPASILIAIELIEEAARALHAAHEAGIIHRDIKPGNIMVTPSDEAVVLDFHRSCMAQEHQRIEWLVPTGTRHEGGAREPHRLKTSSKRWSSGATT